MEKGKEYSKKINCIKKLKEKKKKVLENYVRCTLSLVVGGFSYLQMTNDSYSDKEADQVMAISPV